MIFIVLISTLYSVLLFFCFLLDRTKRRTPTIAFALHHICAPFLIELAIDFNDNSIILLGIILTLFSALPVLWCLEEKTGLCITLLLPQIVILETFIPNYFLLDSSNSWFPLLICIPITILEFVIFERYRKGKYNIQEMLVLVNKKRLLTALAAFAVGLGIQIGLFSVII